MDGVEFGDLPEHRGKSRRELETAYRWYLRSVAQESEAGRPVTDAAGITARPCAAPSDRWAASATEATSSVSKTG